MKTADALWGHLESHELCPGAEDLESWMNVRWIRVRFPGVAVPVIPTWGLRDALTAHDLQHVLTGYDTSLAGEAELAAWELASGGCKWNLFFWVDRILAVLLALPCIPRRLGSAWRRGRACRNLYGQDREALLDSDFEQLREFVSGPGSQGT